jgi:transketolase
MKDYKKLANECRKTVLRMIHEAQTSHIASNFSVIDIATVLYENLKEGDEVVWSCGWKAASIYYFLAKQGKIPYEDLDKFGKEIDGKIPYLGLAETSVPGVHVSGGSMGHGLPVAVGMALAKKKSGEKGNIYCIMSDGELNEGTTWESAMLAGHHKLDNLIFLVDSNGWQAMGKTNEVLDIDSEWGRQVNSKFSTFGFDAFVADGHNHEELENRINHPPILQSEHLWMRPRAIICYTIKGKGVSFMENHLLYHYKQIEKEEYKKALIELQNA